MDEYQIVRLGMRGDGVAEGPVYAARCLPGEVVEAVRDGDRLTSLRIVEPCSDRVTPVCPHYTACGGCQIQHASDLFVALWKTGLVRNALAARGLDAEIRPIATSPEASRRRATFAARRTKKGALAGFHQKSSNTIIPIPACHLLTPELMKGLSIAENLACLAASRKGEMPVSVTVTEQGLDVTAAGGKPLDGPLRKALSEHAIRFDLARLSYDNEVIVVRRSPAQLFKDIMVHPPPGAFLQATKDAELLLQKEVLSVVGTAKHAVDLFAGCGTFALPMARYSKVHAVEGETDMADCIDRAWRKATGLKAVTVDSRDLFRDPLIVDDLSQFDAAVIDPPRAGALAQVTHLAAAKIPKIAYVSCNPATFARDARTLVDEGYILNWVLPIDQFRWSTHVELVASFTF